MLLEPVVDSFLGRGVGSVLALEREIELVAADHVLFGVIFLIEHVFLALCERFEEAVCVLLGGRRRGFGRGSRRRLLRIGYKIQVIRGRLEAGSHIVIGKKIWFWAAGHGGHGIWADCLGKQCEWRLRSVCI